MILFLSYWLFRFGGGRGIEVRIFFALSRNFAILHNFLQFIAIFRHFCAFFLIFPSYVPVGVPRCQW